MLTTEVNGDVNATVKGKYKKTLEKKLDTAELHSSVVYLLL